MVDGRHRSGRLQRSGGWFLSFTPSAECCARMRCQPQPPEPAHPDRISSWSCTEPSHRPGRAATGLRGVTDAGARRGRDGQRGANPSAQPGHRNRPANNSISTRPGSPLTMSTDASGITQEGPPRTSAKKSEGVLARTRHPHAVASASPPPTPTATTASSPPMTQPDPASSTTAASYSLPEPHSQRCPRQSHSGPPAPAPATPATPPPPSGVPPGFRTADLTRSVSR